MAWGTCIYSNKHAFIALLSIDKELSVFNHKNSMYKIMHMNALIVIRQCQRQWFVTVGGLFSFYFKFSCF